MRIPVVILALSLIVSPLQHVLCFEIPGVTWASTALTLAQQGANCSADTPNGIPIFTDPAKILQMYQLMKDVHEVFTHYKITYWIDSGTLLGAVRHQGIIPWDDDLDLCIDKDDLETVYTIAPIFEHLGYEVIRVWGTVHRVQSKSNKELFADLMLMEPRGDKMYFAPILPSYLYRVVYGDWGLYGYRGTDEIYITHDELYPLKEYKFGNLTVMGPQNPAKYLESMYKKDYLDVAYQWHSHPNGIFQGVKKVKMHLTDADRVPAQPLGPLRDRVAALAVLLP